MELYYSLLFRGYGLFLIALVILILYALLNNKIDGSTKGFFGKINLGIGFLLFCSMALSLLICLYTNIFAERDGAVCNDDWVSHSTGSGTCSSHDGVREWTYKYWYEE